MVVVEFEVEVEVEVVVVVVVEKVNRRRRWSPHRVATAKGYSPVQS